MIKQRKRGKKAVFFSLDALIALMIILLSVIVIYPIVKYSQKESYIPEDIISSLSALKIGEMAENNLYVKNLRDSGEIADLNKSVLEQIGEFYISADPTKKLFARELASEVLLTININENIGIWYEDELLASRNKTSFEDAKNINVERQIISGIKEGNATTGFSARAFLTNSVQTKYYYFGGYVGEGNISMLVEYNGSLTNVSLEIAANKDFKICIKDNECEGSFEPVGDEFEPKIFPLGTYISRFDPGVNEFKIVPADGLGNFHIAGGYLKLTYEDGVQYEAPERDYFPGVEGIINIYDGFYVPGILTNLEVHLRARVDDPVKRMYMTFGDLLIFNRSTGGSTIDIDYDNDDISAIFSAAGKDYSDYSEKTIPVRVAVEGVDYVETEVDAEIFSDVMLSGSINSVNVKAKVDGIDYVKDAAVRAANKKLVDILLELTGVYVGLVPTQDGEVVEDGYHELSQDRDSLKNKIDNWPDGGGNKDICAAIQRSVDEFNSSSDFKAIILTFFDSSNHCIEWPDCEAAANKDDCIKNKVCEIAVEKNITFYTVEMNLGDSTPAEITRAAIIEMADCSGGKYVKADDLDDGLMEAYNNIITEIISLIYEMQIIDVIESADADSYLSPESYIEFNYVKEKPPYGIVIIEEIGFSDPYYGSLDIPIDSSILETKVISYSGPRWTKEVSIENSTDTIVIYNLSEYGSSFIQLGDPYAINIPNSAVDIDETNIITLKTGLFSTDTLPGSLFNKIIYTVLKNMVSYSAISEYAEGCKWEVEFEDSDLLTLEIPPGATDPCNYRSDDYGFPGGNDALKTAVYNLFRKLDLDNNGKLDIKFTEQNLEVSSAEIIGIPFPWETEVQVRKWW